VVQALGWGALAASSLALGAVLGVLRPWPNRVIGLVLGLGTGTLVSAVSFELAADGLRAAGLGPVAVGLAVGALTFYLLDAAVDRFTQRRAVAGGAGTSLILGAVLNGIPEMLVLGIQLAHGKGVHLALIAAIFVSNFPEGMGSATELWRKGTNRLRVTLLWTAVAVVLALITPIGAAVANALPPGLTGGFNGFAAGALLVLLIDSMAPEAREKGGRLSGLATTLGFAVTVMLSTVS
jgi:ZIP family zinc transporter